ncbi:hypothetical protein DNU06_02265 [Putridiphycobacter roseus]|uniref:TerB family tellurite resistance protein n=1 Tax=Putridiphycobacter roseus TaxID=2219161 RepID=A0A2W1NI18_9FLAO|nr:hypothetical protein [Putridiphycobacter roseus]PZE18673.1 hypothetical protein DNU06_02265 [Putridiphycobacter roseus]
MQVNWTKEELKIYLLIYCANADFSETKSEIAFIKSKIKTSNFEQLHAEFDKDNDYQSIQKIQLSMKENGYSKEDKDALFEDIKAVFLRDDKYDVLEQNLMIGLGHLLK